MPGVWMVDFQNGNWKGSRLSDESYLVKFQLNSPSDFFDTNIEWLFPKSGG